MDPTEVEEFIDLDGEIPGDNLEELADDDISIILEIPATESEAVQEQNKMISPLHINKKDATATIVNADMDSNNPKKVAAIESVNTIQDLNVPDAAKDVVSNNGTADVPNTMNRSDNSETVNKGNCSSSSKVVKGSSDGVHSNVSKEINDSKLSKVTKGVNDLKNSNVAKGIINPDNYKDKKRRNLNEGAGPIPKHPRGPSKDHSATGSPTADITEATQLRVVEASTSSELSLGDFIAVLEKNTRTIEAQLFMEQLGHVSPKPYGQTMIMSMTSFRFWDSFINAVDGDKWREEADKARRRNKILAKPGVINYGSIGSTQDLEAIYDAIHEVASGSMTMAIIGTRPIMLPSRNIPKWRGMCILHRGGILTGYVPPSLEVLILRGFTSAGVNFDTLLTRSSRLKVLVVDSCQLMAKMWQAICGTSSIQALVCKQRGSCSCARLVANRGYQNQIYLVPEEQNSNYFWKKHHRAQKKIVPEGQKDSYREDKFTLRGHIYYKTPEILPFLCGVLAPAKLVEEAANKKKRSFQLMKLLGA
uniref:NB-ARC domain-containing protein n=1 Tax=Strongyloides papillosus TaxID=174720 RepID=A0A0N5BZ42_STREA